MTEQNNPFVVDQAAYAKEGLIPQGWYLWTLERPRAGTQERGGVQQPVINANLRATEVALYDEKTGQFDGTEELNPPVSKYISFPVSGRRTKLLNSFYKVVTGRIIKGQFNREAKRQELDLLGAAEELDGAQAWNQIYHSEGRDENKEPTGAVYDNLGNNFRKTPPASITVRKNETDEEE